MYADSSATRTIKQISPADVPFIRFLITPLSGHDITPNGKFHIYIRLSKSPISLFRQGSPIYTSRLVIPRPGTDDYYEMKWEDTNDSLRADFVNAPAGGAAPRFRQACNTDFQTTLRTESKLFMQASAAEFSYGDVTTVTTNADDSIVPTRVTHVIAIHTGDSAQISRIGKTGWPKGSFVAFRPNWSDTAKFVVFRTQSDAKLVHADSTNLHMGTNFVMGVGDVIAFTKISGTASTDGKWQEWFSRHNTRWPLGSISEAFLGNVWVDGVVNYKADAQGDDDYEVTIPEITALTEGLTVTFKANTLNTGAATLEITSVGDVDVIAKLSDQVLVTGDILAGQIVTVVWDGGKWQMTSHLAQ